MTNRLYSVEAIRALMPFCMTEDDKRDLAMAIEILEKRTGMNMLQKKRIILLDDVRCVYYWYYGGMRFDSEREYAQDALDNRDFMRWHNIHLIYPNLLPEYFVLHIIVDEDEEFDICVKMNYLTMPYITYDDSENG